MILNINKKHTGSNDINIKLLDKENFIYYNINEILKIENLKAIDDIHSKYFKLFNQLNCNSMSNMHMVVGSENIKNQLCLIKDALHILKNRDMTYYEYHYWKRISLTNQIADSVYDHAGTVTGRSRITKGINYLTMKKEDRNNIQTSFKGGKIIEIDIVSLEPRILCKYNNMTNVNDVYKHTKSILNISHINRQSIKLGLLAIIYGAGKSTVKKLSGIDSDTMMKIKNYYKVDRLSKKLNDDVTKTGLIRNMYNRPIYSKNSLVNHFIQSSAADCAQLAFYNFLEKKDKNYFKLIAVIHDAIIVDVHPKLIDQFMNIYNINEDYLDIKLPVKAEIIA